MLTAALPENPPWPGATLWHLITDPSITVDGDRATAESLWMHVRRGESVRERFSRLVWQEAEIRQASLFDRLRELAHSCASATT